MKKTFYIKTALVAFLATSLFSSCLKDTSREVHFENDAPVCDFALAAAKGVALQTATIKISTPATDIINAVVTIGAPHDFTTPTAVTVAVDAASMTATYATTYQLLPASVYTPTSLTVNVIPGIQQRIQASMPIVGTPVTLPSISEGVVSFTINVPALQALIAANPGVTYMLPLTITGASGNGAVLDQFEHLYFKIATTP
jgi:hypothetical protein